MDFWRLTKALQMIFNSEKLQKLTGETHVKNLEQYQLEISDCLKELAKIKQEKDEKEKQLQDVESKLMNIMDEFVRFFGNADK